VFWRVLACFGVFWRVLGHGALGVVATCELTQATAAAIPFMNGTEIIRQRTPAISKSVR
jgi:hypothetical protein